jgi:hypothetical protein
MNGLYDSIGSTLTLTRLLGFGLPTRVQATLLSKMPGRTVRGAQADRRHLAGSEILTSSPTA